MSEEIKKIIEESTTKAERLEKLDGLNRRLSDEELEAVTGGEDTGNNGCTGGMPKNWKCSGCPKLQHIGRLKDRCTLSGQETGA